MSGRYVKKPVEVEAIQFTADNKADVVRFAVSRTPHGPGDLVVPNATMPMPSMRFWAVKADAFVTIHVGDWVIAEPDGIGVYPCVADAFTDAYEPAEGQP